MSTRRTTQETDRFEVESPDGQRFAIREFTTFIVVQPLSGPPSPPLTGSVAYRCGQRPVNRNDDGTYGVFTGGIDPVRCRRL